MEKVESDINRTQLLAVAGAVCVGGRGQVATLVLVT